MKRLGLLLLFVACTASAEEFPPEALESARRATIEAQKLLGEGDAATARELLDQARERYPRDAMLLAVYGEALFALEQYGKAEIVLSQALSIREIASARTLLNSIYEKYEQYIRNVNYAVIVMQKNTDAGNFDTTIAIGNRALENFPNQETLYNELGHALYLKGDLGAAEAAYRRSLQIDPQNREARARIEEIRSTEDAQTSTELAEWISIAKDKVGDFIVTFLALFAAFLTNHLVAPLILQVKLNNARRLFERGDYDELTDLLEGLLDEENFAPLRSNFRFMLGQKSYEEARDILDRYHNTPERLPTLHRILEREHEKLLKAS